MKPSVSTWSFMIRAPASIAKIPDASGSEVTLRKILRLEEFSPGKYTLRLKLTDKHRNRTLTQSAPFTVT